MYVEAAEHVIKNDLFHEIGIPFNLVEVIKESWENDVHWHLYGRFDLAGGLDGKPIKLLEFNADTPTALFETAIIQWAMLKQNGSLLLGSNVGEAGGVHVSYERTPGLVAVNVPVNLADELVIVGSVPAVGVRSGIHVNTLAGDTVKVAEAVILEEVL